MRKQDWGSDTLAHFYLNTIRYFRKERNMFIMMSKKILAAALSVSSAMIPIVPTAMNATSTFAKSSRKSQAKAKKNKGKKTNGKKVTTKKKSTNKKKPSHNMMIGTGGQGQGHSYRISFGSHSYNVGYGRSW